MNRLSVIVPVYNGEKTIKRAIDSLLNQTEEVDIIIVNDGSTDNTKKICDEYAKKDKRVKVISRDGSGYGQSVNECMDLAKGEYIGIVESDDKIDKNMYETLYLIAKLC